MPQLLSLGIPRFDGLSEGVLSTPRKQVVLLAYLCSRPNRVASRAALATLLWEDRDEPRARQSLRQALLELRRALGSGLVVGDDQVRLADGVVDTDIEAFERAVGEQQWERAVQLWTGDFLAHTEDVGGEAFRGWVESERERLRRLASLAFAEVVRAAALRGDWPAAAASAEQWVRALPLDTAGYPRLVEALALAGRTAEASARCAELVARARNELGVEPGSELVAQGDRLARQHPTRGAPHPGSAAVFSPDFVGRDAELADLIAAWSRCEPGVVSTVVVEGEAGAGKTRLIEEFARRVASSPSAPFTLRARGHRPDPAPAYEGLRALLARVHLSPAAGGSSPTTLALLAEYAPGIRERFRDLGPTSDAPDGLSRALGDLLDALGEEQPLLLVLDDAGALDAETVSLLASTAGSLRSRAMLLVTGRPGEVAPVAALAGLVRLRLHPLRERDLEQMLGTMLALPSPDRRRLASRIFAATRGNPLHTVEVVAALVEEGLVTAAEDGSWRAPEGEGWPLPADLREAVTVRLDRLGDEARSVLDAAAVLRTGLTESLLGRMTGLPGPRLTPALDELIARRLLRVAAPGALEFPHEFTARVAYERLSPERRAVLHDRAAAGLAAGEPMDVAARALVTYHRIRAGTAASRRARLRLAAASVLVAAILAAGYRWLTPTPVAERPRVLVAALDNRTGDTTLDAVGDMAADWVTQGLAQTGLVPIVDLRSARLAETIVRGRGKAPPVSADERVRALARETGAGTVVWGAYYRSADTLVVQSRISDVARGEVVRVLDPIRVPIDQPLRAVEQLRARTAGAFSLMYNRWGSGWVESTRRPPTLEAYESFLAGIDLHVQYRYDEALVEYRRALAADSTYVQPLLWTALAYWSLGRYAQVDSVLGLVERMPDNLGRFDQAMLANARAELRGDWLAARRAAEDMARIAPGSEAWAIVGQEELKLHRPRHALEAFRRAEPERGWLRGWEGYWGFVAGCLHFLDRHDEALDAAREAQRRYPRSVYQVFYEVRELAALGQIDSVRARLQESLTLPPGLWPRGKVYWVAALELAAHGYTDEARRTVQEGLEVTGADPSPATTPKHELRAQLLSLGGRWDDLAALARPLAVHDTTTAVWLGYLGVAAARRQDRALADSVSNVLARRVFLYSFGAADLWRARVAALLGDRERAMTLLRSAIDHGMIFDDRLHFDRDLAVLRGYRPFDELLRPAD